jgi:hypothetical protein
VTRQGYALGWIFGVWCLVLVLESYPAGIYGWVNTGMTLVLAFAALAVAPWAWYALVIGLPLHLVFSAMVVVPIFGQYVHAPLGPWFLTLGVAWHVLWFTYFYRRRAMFGAHSRWHMLERVCPLVVGPDRHVEPRPRIRLGLNPARLVGKIGGLAAFFAVLGFAFGALFGTAWVLSQASSAPPGSNVLLEGAMGVIGFGLVCGVALGLVGSLLAALIRWSSGSK